jgi:TonB family protein
MELSMPRPKVSLAILIVLVASFLNSQRAVFSDPAAPAADPTSTALVVELDRAIAVLKRGLKEGWGTRDQYLTAFEKTPNTDTAGRLVADAKEYVECLMGEHLRIHQIWDEGVPIGVEVKRTIVKFTELRNEAEEAKKVQVATFRPPPCAVPAQRRIVISAGVAASLLTRKVDPVYPAEASKSHVSGTVVLQGSIDAEGRVESLCVISGPPSLQQAAIDAVRQWTYRPYLLNNTPVKVETTFNVVFLPSRQP